MQPLPITFTVTEAKKIKFAMAKTDDSNITPSIATNVEIVNADTYTYPFPTTVYGGTLTVNRDGSGVLTVDSADATYSGGWSISSGGVLYVDDNMVPTGSTPDICTLYLCEKTYRATGANGAKLYEQKIVPQDISDYTRWLLYDPNYTSADNFNTMIATNNMHIVYKLATPIVTTLTALEVIELLKGTNNIYCSTGQVLSAEYPADTKLYIDKKFAELAAAITALGT
jgi:hypothetical protein